MKNPRQKSLPKLKLNQKGYYLADLVASLPLAVLIILAFTFVVINFLRTFEEVKLYTQLQDELFSAIETMRYGYSVDYVTGNPSDPAELKEGLIGLITANEVTIGLDRRSITIKPVILTPGLPYYSNFYLDTNNHLRASGKYGLKSFSDKLIFPTGIKKIGVKDQFRILELNFISEKVVHDKIYLLGIQIKAQVRFREKSSKQTAEEDIRMNTKTIEYKTSVFLTNAKLGTIHSAQPEGI